MTEYYVLIVGLLVAFISCAVVMRSRSSETQKWFMGSSVGAMLYMISEIFMCHAMTVRIYMYTKELKYVSLMWMNISLLLGLYEVCGISLSQRFRRAVYFFAHFYCIVNLTIGLHKWFYSDVKVVPIDVGAGLYSHETEKAWMYYALSVYGVVFFSFIILHMLVKIVHQKGRKMEIIRIIIILPAIHLSMQILHILDLFDGSILNHMTYMLQCILIMILMIRYDITVMTPQIKEQAVEYAENGIIILDRGYHFTYANNSAKRLLPWLYDENPDTVTEYIKKELSDSGEGYMTIGEQRYGVHIEEERDETGNRRGYLITLNNITLIAKAKERIDAELELSRKIQADSLPAIFPPFPDRTEFDIYASMTPAKEVGGDFYDFFLIDDDHLGMVMADVSGKGVPAALFMMMSKNLIGNYAMQGDSPARVLELANDVICEHNEEEMFVTVWLGVLEISTGRITAANAGHEFPIIRKANGDFEIFRDKHGFVIGGLPGAKYKDYEFRLEKGGMIFLYTDGVPEATNAAEELFGTDRLLEAMNANMEKDTEAILAAVKNAVNGFVGSAEQFDDLTMLGLKYYG